MIVAVLNGWGSSSRLKETRTAALVREETCNLNPMVLARRAMIGWSRARKFRRFILEHQSPDEVLLCVGKSLGARNMVSKILNKLPPMSYRRVGLLTIDPCWPLRWDWKPNLNRHTLSLTCPVDRAVNLFAVLPQDQQAGAMLKGNNVKNYPLAHVDHYTIVQAEDVEDELRILINFLIE